MIQIQPPRIRLVQKTLSLQPRLTRSWTHTQHRNKMYGPKLLPNVLRDSRGIFLRVTSTTIHSCCAFLTLSTNSRTGPYFVGAVYFLTGIVIFKLDLAGSPSLGGHVGTCVGARTLTATQIRVTLAHLMYHGDSSLIHVGWARRVSGSTDVRRSLLG